MYTGWAAKARTKRSSRAWRIFSPPRADCLKDVRLSEVQHELLSEWVWEDLTRAQQVAFLNFTSAAADAGLGPWFFGPGAAGR